MGLALLLVVMAVIISFVDEFGALLKKIASIWSVRLFFPLIVVSSMIVQYEQAILTLLLKFRESLHAVVRLISLMIPFGSLQLRMSLAQMMVLFLMACVPLWCFWGYKRYRKLTELWPYAYLVGLVTWLSGAILMTAI